MKGQNMLRQKMKKAVTMGLGVILVFSLAACKGDASESDRESGDPVIRIGSKDFTENMIVSEIYALALEDAGYEVERNFSIAGSLIHTSITSDEIDLYPEYTGTGLLSVLKMDMITDPQEVYDTVKKEYDAQFQLTWLDYSKANDGQGLVIRTAAAEKLKIKTISDLQENADQIRFASQGEFDERDDGLPALEEVYGAFNWKSSKIYDNGLKYEVLSNDEADAAPAYTTEGQLVNVEEYTLLEDDKQVWPPYNLAPVVQNDVLERVPEIADILNEISASLDTAKVTELNAKVDVEKEEVEEVAAQYYESIQK